MRMTVIDGVTEVGRRAHVDNFAQAGVVVALGLEARGVLHSLDLIKQIIAVALHGAARNARLILTLALDTAGEIETGLRWELSTVIGGCAAGGIWAQCAGAVVALVDLTGTGRRRALVAGEATHRVGDHHALVVVARTHRAVRHLGNDALAVGHIGAAALVGGHIDAVGLHAPRFQTGSTISTSGVVIAITAARLLSERHRSAFALDADVLFAWIRACHALLGHIDTHARLTHIISAWIFVVAVHLGNFACVIDTGSEEATVCRNTAVHVGVTAATHNAKRALIDLLITGADHAFGVENLALRIRCAAQVAHRLEHTALDAQIAHRLGARELRRCTL